jgi:hypothetical protein
MPVDRPRGIAWLLALAVVASLIDCGKSSLKSWVREAESTAPVLQGTDIGSSAQRKYLNHIGQLQTDPAPWLEAAREDPDPRVPLHAIESWAKKPGKHV